EENQAGDEIVDDLLQAETDADAERAHEDRDPGQIEAERGEREEASDDEQSISGQVGERVRYTARQLHPRVDVLFEEEHDRARSEVGAGQYADERDHVADREIEIAELEMRVEDGRGSRGGGIGEAEACQRDASPDPERHHVERRSQPTMD